MVYHILSLILALILTGNCADFTTFFSPVQSNFPSSSISEPSTPSVDTPIDPTPAPDGAQSQEENSGKENTTSLVSYFASYDFSQPVPTCFEVDNSYFADAAFVGDSRTEGFFLYSKVKQGKLVSYTGLTVFGALGAKVINVNGTMYTVPDALALDSYSKIYLCFGVNELGYRDTEAYYRTYCQLIDAIRVSQPRAIIYVQTLIPVNDNLAAATGHGSYVNCERLRQFNDVIRRVANDKRVPLLDIYSAFAVDDQLPEEASRDGVHLVPEYCEKQLDFYRRHAIPADAFANIVPEEPAKPVAPTKPTPAPSAPAPSAPAPSRPAAAPVAPAPQQPAPEPAVPETPTTADSPAVPVPPTGPEVSHTPEAPADSVNPVQPAPSPVTEAPTAPETPTTQTIPEATV